VAVLPQTVNVSYQTASLFQLANIFLLTARLLSRKSSTVAKKLKKLLFIRYNLVGALFFYFLSPKKSSF